MGNYSFSDIIKSSFLAEVQAVSMSRLVTTLVLTFLLGIFIVAVYRLTYSGVLFSWNFALSLLLLGLVTAGVILAVSSNVILSLRMVGALSIVRFRTAVKDAMDTVFMFWAIGAGIMAGAGYITVALAATGITGALFLGATVLRQTITSRAYMIIVRYEPGAQGVREALAALKTCRLRSESLTGREEELVAEARLSARTFPQAERLRDLPGVLRVDIVGYNGDTML